MVRKILAIIAVLIVGLMFGYVLGTNNTAEIPSQENKEAGRSQNNFSDESDYFLIPELGVRFKNVQGLTPIYVLVDGSPRLSSKEVMALAFKDPRFTGCVTEGFSYVTVTSTPSNDEMVLANQISIGKGKYLQIAGPQAVCWYAPDLTAEQQANDPSVKEFQNQAKLFGSFLNSAQAY